MGKVIMIGAMKGGVGKSVTTFNLAYSLQKKGKKVLAVDFDPQSNLTTCFGAEDVDVAIGDLMLAVIEDEELPEREEYIWERNGVDFIPSSIGLSAVEAKLRLEMGTEKMLAAILEPLRDDYDFIFIDCPPSLSLLTLNALTAADSVLIPIQCEYYALEGVGQLVNTIKLMRMKLNPELKVEGILLTMYDARTNLCAQVAQEVRNHFSDEAFDTVIPRNVDLAAAPGQGKAILDYKRRSSGGKAYHELALEVKRLWL